jgi:hypothetical protein
MIAQSAYTEGEVMEERKIWKEITPETWIQFCSPVGEYRCALDWIDLVYPLGTETIQHQTVTGQLRRHLGIFSIATWNDSPERTFEDVQAAFKAIDR